MAAMHEAVAAEVHDTTRAAQLNQAIDKLGTEIIAIQEQIVLARADFTALNARPDATRAEFETLQTQYDARRRTMRARLIEAHMQLIDATTADEWKKLSRYEHDALTAGR